MRTRNRAPGHPGLILKRLYLDSLQISNARLAGCIGVSRKTISKIVNGRGAITPEMALRLSRAFNTSLSFGSTCRYLTTCGKRAIALLIGRM